jgi:hypothetical protein
VFEREYPVCHSERSEESENESRVDGRLTAVPRFLGKLGMTTWLLGMTISKLRMTNGRVGK